MSNPRFDYTYIADKQNDLQSAIISDFIFMHMFRRAIDNLSVLIRESTELLNFLHAVFDQVSYQTSNSI